MLDIQFIREHPDIVKKAAKNKNVDVDIDQLLKSYDEQRSLKVTVDSLRQQRNQLAEKTKSGQPNQEDITQGKVLKKKLESLEESYTKARQTYESLLLEVPNVPANDVPIGIDQSANQVLRMWGEKPQFDFVPKDHEALGRDLDLIDKERAAKVTGTRFAYLKGSLVQLEFALMQFAMDTLTDVKLLGEIAKSKDLAVKVTPFIPVLPPALVRSKVFRKTGRLDPAEDKYYLEPDDLYLIGSAEQSLAPMHMDEVLGESQLPLRYVGFSTSFRREAGSYGKDIKGIFRMHQFNKLEIESLTTPGDSGKEQEFIIAIQEYLMQQLKLPYQVVAISTGDMGKPDYRQIDIETWLPGQNSYRETHTSDHNSDFQSRRLNIRYRSSTGEVNLVHMNDATVFSERPLIAILENYQTKDGKVRIPEVLLPYMKGEYL